METASQPSETSLRDEIVSLRQSQNLTIDQLHEKYPSLSRASIGRLIRGIKPQKNVASTELKTEIRQTEISHETNDIENNGDISQISSPSHISSQQNISSSPGSIELLEEDRASIRKLVPQKVHGPLESIYEIAARRQRFNNNNGHGHGVPSYGSGDDEVKRAKAHLYESMAETEEMERLEDLKQRRSDRHTKTETKENPYEKLFLELIAKTIINNKGEQLGIKELVELSKLFAGSSMKETMGLVDYIQHSQKEGQAITLNEIALKIEEMKQQGQLENRKLDWEMQKHQDEKDSQAQLYGIVGSVVKGPVSDLIGVFGNAAAERLKGKQQPPIEPIQISCPSCKKPFWTDPRLEVITCGLCGARLQKLGIQGPQQTAQPQPQLEQPQAQAETPVTQETQTETLTNAETKEVTQ